MACLVGSLKTDGGPEGLSSEPGYNPWFMFALFHLVDTP